MERGERRGRVLLGGDKRAKRCKRRAWAIKPSSWVRLTRGLRSRYLSALISSALKALGNRRQQDPGSEARWNSD